MKIRIVLTLTGMLLLSSCAIHTSIWDRQRSTLSTLSPSAETALASARAALLRDTGVVAGCYIYEIESAGDDFIVSFFSPPANTSTTTGEVVVVSGAGSCGQGRVYAVSRSGIVLDSKFGR